MDTTKKYLYYIYTYNYAYHNIMHKQPQLGRTCLISNKHAKISNKIRKSHLCEVEYASPKVAKGCRRSIDLWKGGSIAKRERDGLKKEYVVY